MMTLSPPERAVLLRELSQIGAPPLDQYRPRPSNSQALLRPSATFTRTAAHVAALAPACQVVYGERGSGVSALCRLLLDVGTDDAHGLRPFFSTAAGDTRFLDAFCAGAPQHPTPEQFAELARSGEAQAAQVLWAAHLIRRLEDVPKLWPALLALHPPLRSLAQQDQLARAPGATLDELLDDAERWLAKVGMTLCACYDDLETLEEPALRALVAFWRSLRARCRHLQVKLFLRTPHYEKLRVQPELARLGSVRLRWNEAELFSALVRHMQAAGPVTRAWLQAIPALGLRESIYGLLPGPMDEDARKALGDELIGVVGPEIAPIYGHRFLEARIRDARGEATPRTLVALIGAAAEAAAKDPPPSLPPLLRERDLREGLRQAGLARLRELEDDHPVLGRLRHLAGRRMPMRQETLAALLGQAVPGEPERVPTDGLAVVGELSRLAVLSPRTQDGLYDLPDLFLAALQLRRRVRAQPGDGEVIPKEAGALRLEAESLAEHSKEEYRRESERAARAGELPDRAAYARALGEAQHLVERSLDLRPDDVPACVLLCDLVRRLSWLLPAAEAAERVRRVRTRIEGALPGVAARDELRLWLGMLTQRLSDAEPAQALAHLGEARAHFEHLLPADSAARPFLPLLHLAWVTLDLASCEPAQARVHLDRVDCLQGEAQALPIVQGRAALRGWLLDLRAAWHVARARWLGAPDEYDEADARWQEATQRAPGEARSLTRWGAMLIEATMAGRPFASLASAEEKLEAARRLEPDRLAMRAARIEIELRRAEAEGTLGPPERLRAWQDALLDVARHAPAAAAYSLCCLYGLQGDAESCAAQIELARQGGYLPPADLVLRDPCLTVCDGTALREALAGWPSRP